MMKTMMLVCLLVACGDNVEDVQPDAAVMVDAGPTVCDPTEGSLCSAAYDVARTQCDRSLRCNPGVQTYDVCLNETVSSLCEQNDCTATYGYWGDLYDCITNYDQIACVTTYQPLSCSMWLAGPEGYCAARCLANAPLSVDQLNACIHVCLLSYGGTP